MGTPSFEESSPELDSKLRGLLRARRQRSLSNDLGKRDKAVIFSFRVHSNVAYDVAVDDDDVVDGVVF